MENNEIIIIESQEKKYSTPEILQIFHEYLQVNKNVIKIETKNNEAIWGCTLQEGDTILFDSDIIFQSKNEAKADVIYKYLKQKNLLNFSDERKKSTPKITAMSNPKNVLDNYLQNLRITPTINYSLPDFTCNIALNYKDKFFQSQSRQSINKSIACYEAAKDMLKQLSFLDDEAMKLYRIIDKNYFRYGTSAPFEENDLIELKASNIYNRKEWGVEDLKSTLNGYFKVIRSFANYICAYLNAKKGGSIYYGIYDIGSLAYGYLLSDKERDELTQILWKTISTSFFPLIDKSLVSIYFHLVEGEEDGDSLVLMESEKPKDLEKSPPKEGIQKKKTRKKKELNGAGKDLIPQKKNNDPKRRFILEISVSRNPPEPVYWYNDVAYEKIDNSLIVMRPELIYSNFMSHTQSKPLLN